MSGSENSHSVASAWHDPVRVLSIDGGGIRGIIPTVLLAELEARSGSPISSMFDLIAGTSIGGIIALCLAAPGDLGTPAWSATRLLEIFEKAAHEIFVPAGHSVLHGILHYRYASEFIEATLTRYLGESMLSDAVCDVLLTTYDLNERELIFLNSMEAKADVKHDLPMWIAGRATSAAPTYFEPARMLAQDPRLLLDGAVCANNPAMCAFAEVIKYRKSFDMLLVSMGTGSSSEAISHHQVRDWGLAQWARPILHVIMDGASDAVHRQLREILPSDAYYRFQIELEHASESMDDASPLNIERLLLDASRLMKASDRELDALCELLTK